MYRLEEIESHNFVAYHRDQNVRVGDDWITENVLGLGDTQDEAIENALDNAGHNSIDLGEIDTVEVSDL